MQHSAISPPSSIHVIVTGGRLCPAVFVRALHYVVNLMRRSRQILLSTALLLACGHAAASAVETQQISADTSTGCPDNSAAANDRGELGDADPSATTVAPVRRTEKAKTMVTPRSTGTRAAAPRWHSFLPGMMR